MNLLLRLQPKQAELLDMVEHSPASWIGYGGARGGSKSGGARRVMIQRRFENPGTWGLIFRRVYDDLKRNHIDKLFEEYPQLQQFYNKADHELLLPNKSKIVFGYAETLDEVKRKFHGPEYMDIFIDQAEQLSEQELQLFKLACRWPGVPDNKCKFVLFFNPGPPGLPFLKRIFGDKRYTDRERADDYAFIQAYGWDNIEWVRSALIEDGKTEKDFYSWDGPTRFQYFITRSQYGRELNALPKALRIGHLMGSLDEFTGQYFSNYDKSKRVIHPAQALELIKSWWPRWISSDWGFHHHWVTQWHATGKVTKEDAARVLQREWPTDKTVTITYRELAENEVSERVYAEKIVASMPKGPDGKVSEGISRFILSPDAFGRKAQNQHSMGEEIASVVRPFGIPYPIPADDARVLGWRFMYGLIERDEWFITSNCPVLPDALQMLAHAEGKPEDVEKTEHISDDSADCARYGLKTMLSPGKKPLQDVITETLIAIPDPTQRYVQHQKLIADAQKKAQPILRTAKWRNLD